MECTLGSAHKAADWQTRRPISPRRGRDHALAGVDRDAHPAAFGRRIISMLSSTKTAVLGLMLMGGASAFAMPESCRPNQFVLVDVTFTMTQEEGMKTGSHYYVRGDKFNPDRPKDWTTPVDYRNGTLHVRAEVFKKPPGTQTTGWTLCYIANVGNYGCADTDYYTSPGVFERETKMTSFWATAPSAAAACSNGRAALCAE